MDEAGENRIPIRVPEWAKKLHPDALRSRLRNFRRYVISAAIEKRNNLTSTSREEDLVSPVVAHLPRNCDTAMSSKHQYEKLVTRHANIDDGAGSQCEIGEHKSNVDSAQIADTIARNNSLLSPEEADEPTLNNSNNNLQLAINIESTPRNKSPITVQEWVDSLPLTPAESAESSREEDELPDKTAVPLSDCENDTLILGAEAGCLMDKKIPATISPSVNVTITGCQEPSEVESHCSSLDSLLEARKPDPEEVLLSLGFGGTASSSYLETGRIPRRFLQQSQLKGVDIDDFIRQQQDLIYTFESGYYGYRGLAGPSHSNPSVIVAKILEKLREHERETTSMTSYQLDFRKHCSLEKNVENVVSNKFSKVARNVLTKIRCTPSSVLSPDNRRWLDSQGSKSPEIARRLIIGQKSFTFGRDGDLIEASNLDTVNRVDSKDDSSEMDTTTGRVQPKDQYDQGDRSPGRRCELDRRLTDSSTDVSVESMIPKNELPNRDSVVRHPSRREGEETKGGDAIKMSPLKRLDNVDAEDELDCCGSGSLDSCATSSAQERNSRETYNPLPNTRVAFGAPVGITVTAADSDADVSALQEHTRETSGNESDTAASRNRRRASSSEGMSLREELYHSGVPLTDASAKRGSLKKFKNVLTRCSSFEESCKENSDDDLDPVNENSSTEDYQCAEAAYRYADSATESEFASYSHRSLTNKHIHRQYEELILLQTVLHSCGRPIKLITKDQFSAISSEQRCAVQAEIIREALKAYLNQMTDDEIHLELKNCLSAEVQKVADLLDASSDVSKFAVIVKQMTLLLQHQTQLSTRIRELSVIDEKPTSCHEMCDHILKRVHELELLVQQNAQELAQMKYQLLKKDNF